MVLGLGFLGQIGLVLKFFFFVFLVAGEHHDANFVFSTTTSTEIPKKCLDGPFINPSLLCAKSLSAAAYRMKRFMVFSKVGNIHGILQSWKYPWYSPKLENTTDLFI